MGRLKVQSSKAFGTVFFEYRDTVGAGFARPKTQSFLFLIEEKQLCVSVFQSNSSIHSQSPPLGGLGKGHKVKKGVEECRSADNSLPPSL